MDCKTRYPLLLLHGMGFRDGKICYWGRIPRVLEKNGASIFYGFQDANASVMKNAQTIAVSLEKALSESGAEKVNIIAHSKGGLEARYLISSMGFADRVASLTTISTPHNGSAAIDKVLRHFRPAIYAGSRITDIIKRIGGDVSPDTYRCICEFSTDFMKKFNEENPDSPDIRYMSCAFVMKNIFSDITMAFPYICVKAMSGDNDGFLTPEEVRHGEFLGTFTGTGRRGISHCDEVDLRRKKLSGNIPKDRYSISDIADFYTELVSMLKEKGF